VCKLRVRYGVCFQSGSINIDALGCVSLCVCVCVCALYMACSSAFVSLLGWNSGSERIILVQAVLVRGSAEKSLLNGSFE